MHLLSDVDNTRRVSHRALQKCMQVAPKKRLISKGRAQSQVLPENRRKGSEWVCRKVNRPQPGAGRLEVKSKDRRSSEASERRKMKCEKGHEGKKLYICMYIYENKREQTEKKKKKPFLWQSKETSAICHLPPTSELRGNGLS